MESIQSDFSRFVVGQMNIHDIPRPTTYSELVDSHIHSMCSDMCRRWRQLILVHFVEKVLELNPVNGWGSIENIETSSICRTSRRVPFFHVLNCFFLLIPPPPLILSQKKTTVDTCGLLPRLLMWPRARNDPSPSSTPQNATFFAPFPHASKMQALPCFPPVLESENFQSSRKFGGTRNLAHSLMFQFNKSNNRGCVKEIVCGHTSQDSQRIHLLDTDFPPSPSSYPPSKKTNKRINSFVSRKQII